MSFDEKIIEMFTENPFNDQSRSGSDIPLKYVLNLMAMLIFYQPSPTKEF